MRQLSKPKISASSTVGVSRTGGQRSWDSSANELEDLKDSFRAWALTSQNHRCAFCLAKIGHVLARRGIDIDHFAPKETYPRWTFETMNWIVACSSCNQHFKSRYDPVVPTSKNIKNSIYYSTEFTLVHPYLDKLDNHLCGGFMNDNRRPTPIQTLDDKGRETVRLFDLASPDLLSEWKNDYRRNKFDRLPPILQYIYDRILDSL